MVYTYMVYTYNISISYMSKVNHIVALNTTDGSEALWEEMFSKEDNNFSEWVRLKLHEEKEKRMDKDYIYKKLSESESQTIYWKKQLNKAEDHIRAKEQTKQQDLPEEEYQKQIDKAVWRLKIYKNVSDEELVPIAEQYIKIPENIRPNARDFIKQMEEVNNG